jgi:alpha-D-ribose 1-methylphosphonate 5-phosphate C-P lyase
MKTTNEATHATAAYNFAFLDETSKREIRRQTLKAVSIPGYQVPFVSRELPIAKGWGTGGLQLTLSLIRRDDCLKVIDQGSDESVNAVSIRRFVRETADVPTTEETEEATLIQSRHRVPEEPLREDQILVLQVPQPEPLRFVEPHEEVTRKLHAVKDYSSMWLQLYENIVKYDSVAIHTNYPVMVHDRYLMAPTPIPRWDNLKLHQADHLTLFGAGREKRIYAVPPHTKVLPIHFDDYPFTAENMSGKRCRLCGSTHTFLDEIVDGATGDKRYQCSDTAYCKKRRKLTDAGKEAIQG